MCMYTCVYVGMHVGLCRDNMYMYVMHVYMYVSVYRSMCV